MCFFRGFHRSSRTLGVHATNNLRRQGQTQYSRRPPFWKNKCSRPIRVQLLSRLQQAVREKTHKSQPDHLRLSPSSFSIHGGVFDGPEASSWHPKQRWPAPVADTLPLYSSIALTLETAAAHPRLSRLKTEAQQKQAPMYLPSYHKGEQPATASALQPPNTRPPWILNPL